MQPTTEVIKMHYCIVLLNHWQVHWLTATVQPKVARATAAIAAATSSRHSAVSFIWLAIENCCNGLRALGGVLVVSM